MADQSDDLLDSFVDRTKVAADKVFILENLEEVQEALNKLSKLKIDIGGASGLGPIADGAAKAKPQIDALAAANKKLLDSYTPQAQELANIKVQQSLVTKANTDAAKETLGLVGAYDRLSKEYLTAAKAAKDYAASTDADATEVERLAKVANDLQTKLKGIDASVGQFNRNVGNYAGSLGGAFAILQNELKGVQDKIKATNSADAGFANLVKEEKLLATLTESLNRGFSSTAQELKAYEKALKTLGVETGLENQLFQKLSVEVGEVKDKVGDVQSALKFQASDTKYLDAAIGAVQGLAGAYGVAQGAAQLFGADEQELQKSMVKLQAIMTIIQSLQAVQNALLTENAAVQGVLAAKTGLSNLAALIQSKILTTQAALLPEVVIETEALAVAEGEAALAAEGLAVGMEEVAVTTATATAATTTLATVLAATGIGAILLAIGAAVVYLTKKIPDWIHGTQLSIEQQGKLADSLQKTRQALIDQADQIEQLDRSTQRSLNAQLELSTSYGENQYKQLALQRQLNTEEKYQAGERLKLLKQNGDTQANLSADVQKYANRNIEAQRLLDIAIKTRNKDDEEQYQKVIDTNDKKIASAKGLADALISAEDRVYKANLDGDKLTAETAKLTAEERRKLILETAQLETSTVQSKNAIILASEEATLTQRLAALKSNADAQKRLALAQQADVNGNVASTPNDRAIAAAVAEQKINEIQRNNANELFQLRREYATRDQLALLAETKSELDTRIKTNDLIVDNDKKSFDERLKALQTSLEARKAELLNQYNIDKDQLGVTDEQKKAIDVKYYADSAQLTVDYGIKQLALYKVNQEKITEAIEKETQKRADLLSADNNKRVSDLTNGLLKGNISFTQYSKERAQIEAQNNIDATFAEVEAQGKRVRTYKEGTAERAAAEKKFSEDVLGYQQSIISADQLATQQRIDDLTKVKDYGDQVFDIIGGAISASITAQKNKLQQQSDNIDKNSQKEIDAVNASVATEQDKAAKITVINAKAQAQKDQIAAENRKLDQKKAEADKIKAIFDIILNTAVAVTAAKSLPERLAAAAIGVAELAIAYATPVPKFKSGRDKGGKATMGIVGDGGRQEVMYSPDFKEAVVTPATDTLAYVPKGWGIAPSVEEFRDLAFKQAARPVGRMPASADGNQQLIYAMMHEISGLKVAVMNKQEVHFNWDQGELETAIKNGANTVTYLNRNLR